MQKSDQVLIVGFSCKKWKGIIGAEIMDGYNKSHSHTHKHTRTHTHKAQTHKNTHKFVYRLSILPHKAKRVKSINKSLRNFLSIFFGINDRICPPSIPRSKIFRRGPVPLRPPPHPGVYTSELNECMANIISV